MFTFSKIMKTNFFLSAAAIVFSWPKIHGRSASLSARQGEHDFFNLEPHVNINGSDIAIVQWEFCDVCEELMKKWEKEDNGWSHVQSDGCTFDEAEEACRKMGGELAVLNTLEALKAAGQHIDSIYHGHAWIGGRKNINETLWTEEYKTRWFWRTGEEIPLSWAGWKPGYPAKTNKEILHKMYDPDSYDYDEAQMRSGKDKVDMCLIATCPQTTRLFCSTEPGIRSMPCDPNSVRGFGYGSVRVESFICDLGPVSTPSPTSTPTPTSNLTSSANQTSNLNVTANPTTSVF